MIEDTEEVLPDDTASAALREAADTIAGSVHSVLAPVFVHVKELEQELEMRDDAIEELHAEIEKLAAKLERRTPEETAARLYEFFHERFDREGNQLLSESWKLTSGELRGALIALSSELFGVGDAGY